MQADRERQKQTIRDSERNRERQRIAKKYFKKRDRQTDRQTDRHSGRTETRKKKIQTWREKQTEIQRQRNRMSLARHRQTLQETTDFSSRNTMDSRSQVDSHSQVVEILEDVLTLKTDALNLVRSVRAVQWRYCKHSEMILFYTIHSLAGWQRERRKRPTETQRRTGRLTDKETRQTGRHIHAQWRTDR